MMRRTAWTFALTLLAATALQHPAAAQAPAPTSLKVGMSVPDVAQLLLYTAVAKGFTTKEGLDVELVQFQNDPAAAQALTAGAVQVNSASIVPVLDAFVAKRDIVSVFSTSNLPGYTWYGLAKYTSIQDLKHGGKVGVSNIASLTHRISSWAMARVGVDPEKDVQFIPLGGPMERVAALRAGQVDVIPATPPGTYILAEEGFKPLLELKDILPQFEYEVFYMRRGMIAPNEEAIKSLIRATIKAKAWALQNPDETADIFMKALGAPEDQRKYYRKTVDFALPYFPDDGHYADESIGVFLQFYKDQGRIKDIPDRSAFSDDRFLEYFKQNPIQ